MFLDEAMEMMISTFKHVETPDQVLAMPTMKFLKLFQDKMVIEFDMYPELVNDFLGHLDIDIDEEVLKHPRFDEGLTAFAKAARAIYDAALKLAEGEKAEARAIFLPMARKMYFKISS